MEGMEMETTLSPGTTSSAGGVPESPLGGGIAAQVEREHVGNSGGAGGGALPGKRGRPVKHGLYSKAMGSDGKTAVKAPGPLPVAAAGPGAVEGDQSADRPAPRVAIPPDLLAKIVKAGIGFGENKFLTRIESAGKRAGLMSAEMSPHLADAKLGEERKELVADLAPLVAKEWGLDVEVSPTMAVAAILGPWAWAAQSSLNTLEKLAKERAERERRQNAQPV